MSHRFHGACASVLLAAALLAQEPGATTFDANAKLVLVPFHVQRGKYFAADLQPADVILREDGHPLPFTTFEGPNTPHPLPLELILLFDTTRKVPVKESGVLRNALSAMPLDPKADYKFLDNRDESITREILQMNEMDIRLAVYHFAGRQLERLCAAGRDAREIVRAFHSLLDPIPEGKGELTLLPGDNIAKPMFGPPPKSGWLGESIVGTLKDAAASPVPARRLLIVFTQGSSGTTATPGYSSIVDPALAMSIPFDTVVMDMDEQEQHLSGRPLGPGGMPALSTADAPLSSGNSGKPGDIAGTWYKGFLPWSTRAGELTGGQTFVPHQLDRETLARILSVERDAGLSQHVVGFSPDAAAKPKKHTLSVALTSKSTGKLVGGEKDGVMY